MFIVVIGSATHGLAFVGPFPTEAVGQDYIGVWRNTHPDKASVPIGVVPLHAPDDFKAGVGLQ